MISHSFPPCSPIPCSAARHCGGRPDRRRPHPPLALLIIAALSQVWLPCASLAMRPIPAVQAGAGSGSSCTGDPDDGEHRPYVHLEPELPNSRATVESSSESMSLEAVPRESSWLIWVPIWTGGGHTCVHVVLSRPLHWHLTRNPGGVR